MRQLPKAPEAEQAAAEADAAAKAAAERAARQADVAALRALRMGLRDVTTRLLCDRRWRAFAEPVTPEEDPEYLELVRFGRCHAADANCPVGVTSAISWL